MTTLSLERARAAIRDRVVLDGVSLKLSEGDFVAIVGSNGAGKTSLFRAALGLLPIDSGSIELDGVPLPALTAHDRASKLGWLPQGIHSYDIDAPSAVEFVENGRYRFSESTIERRRAAIAYLERAGMGDTADRRLSELSGGERQRVAIAALLAQEAPLLLLDEPAQNLDPAQQILLYRLIGDLAREGRGIACISHDINLLVHLGLDTPPRVLGLDSGREAFSASLDDPELASHLGALFGVVFETTGEGRTKRFVATSVQ